MTEQTNPVTFLVLLQFSVVFLTGDAWGTHNKFNGVALNEPAHPSSGDAYAGDVYLADGNYIVVDDMESYNDSNNFIWDTWWSGCVDANGMGSNGTGSCVRPAIDPVAPVHSGGKSMWYAYWNTGCCWGYCEYYSEIERIYSTPQDWAGLGAKAVSLWFFGDLDNDVGDAERMYVALEDDTGIATPIHHGHYGEDVNDVKIPEWHEWNIALQDFADGGTDPARIVGIYIGFGDRNNPVLGGDGVVYFDDIRLYPARCLARYAPAADLTGDCLVDRRDLKIMAEQWLYIDGEATQDTVAGAATAYSAGDCDDRNACGPFPDDGQTKVQSAMAEVTLSWQPGCCIGDRGRHGVYFGIDADCVANASPDDPNCWVGFRRANELYVNVGNLPLWQTFYWRVDEYNEDGSRCKGNVWRFTTGCKLVAGDLNRDCLVNSEDYAMLVGGWLEQVPLWPP